MRGAQCLASDAILKEIMEAVVNTRKKFAVSLETTLEMALDAFCVAQDSNNSPAMATAVNLIAKLSGIELQVEAQHAERIGERIKEVLFTYSGREVSDILEQAAPQAAALLVEVATGGIQATTAERIAAARNIVDRVQGTPIGQDVMEAKTAADDMLKRIQNIENGRAKLSPV